MQDTMIQGLLHKFNDRGISYSISKCHVLYEKQLQLTNYKTQKNDKTSESSFGLI